jgi:hypothetical protein
MPTFTDRAGGVAQVIATPDILLFPEGVSRVRISNTVKTSVWTVECPALWGVGVVASRVGEVAIVLESPKNAITEVTINLLASTGTLIWEVELPEI